MREGRERRDLARLGPFCAGTHLLSSWWLCKQLLGHQEQASGTAFLLTALFFFAFWNKHNSQKGFKIYVFNFTMDWVCFTNNPKRWLISCGKDTISLCPFSSFLPPSFYPSCPSPSCPSPSLLILPFSMLCGLIYMCVHLCACTHVIWVQVEGPRLMSESYSIDSFSTLFLR